MKLCFHMFAFLSVLLFSTMTNAGFVEGFEDIPLAEGFNQIEKGALSFGNEEIRFIERYLTSATNSFSDAKKFYGETLPQMGWNKKGESATKISFERDGEVLEINKESEKPLIVRLTVKSKN